MGKRIKTVIASVLKPVDDTRMYEKIGLSLQQTNIYDVNIIGFRTKNIPKNSEINFYPCFNFGRKSIRRLLAPLTFLYFLIKMRPQMVIISTYELIPSALVYRFVFSRTHLVYDVQENYALNVLSNRKSDLLASVWAGYVRWVESVAQPMISLNIVAETRYSNEINYLNNSLVLLNKFNTRCSIVKFTKINSIYVNSPLKLIFSGTVSTDYGIWQSVEFVNELAKIFPLLKAKFIGRVPDQTLLRELLSIQNNVVEFNIDTEPIAHKAILEEMSTADFGIVAHQPTLSIQNCFPTRIYELMHFRIPILLQDHPPWVAYCQQWNSCIPLDFNHYDVETVAAQMMEQRFYNRGTPDDIYWESEEKKLIKAVDLLFNINS